jgi:hypothetical protein
VYYCCKRTGVAAAVNDEVRDAAATEGLADGQLLVHAQLHCSVKAPVAVP